MKKLALLLMLSPLCVYAQTGVVQGHCFLGGKQAITSGMNSTNYANGIVPACTVTVYLTGTTTKQTITKPDGSALANPFTANTATAVDPGGWIFRAATNVGLDVVMSGGNSNPSCITAPNCYTAPVTLTDVFVSSSFNPISGSMTLTGQNAYTCTSASCNISGASLSLQHGGVSVTDQNLMNWLDTPASLSGGSLDSGYQPVVFKTDTAGGWAAETVTPLASSQLQMYAIPPTTGNYVIARATVSGASFGSGGCTPGTATATSTTLYTFTGPTGGLCSSGATGDWSSFVAASLPVGATITALYPYGIGGGSWITNFTCSYNGGSAKSVGGGSYSQYTGTTSGWGTNLSLVTCHYSAGSSSSGGRSFSYKQSDLGVFVFYTGAAPPTNSNVQVIPPLAYDQSTQKLATANPADGAVDTGVVDAYVVSLGDTAVGPSTGTTVSFVPAHSSTSATPTLNMNSFGAVTIVGPSGKQLAVGDLSSSAVARLFYGQDANWHLENPQVSYASSGQGPSQTVVSSATTIAPTKRFFHVSGTTTISTITAPAFCVVTGTMCQITLIPDGLWSTTTGGNIALGTTAVVGKALLMTYDPATTSWYPSY